MDNTPNEFIVVINFKHQAIQENGQKVCFQIRTKFTISIFYFNQNKNYVSILSVSIKQQHLRLPPQYFNSHSYLEKQLRIDGLENKNKCEVTASFEEEIMPAIRIANPSFTSHLGKSITSNTQSAQSHQLWGHCRNPYKDFQTSCTLCSASF